MTDASRSDEAIGATGERLDALLRALANEHHRQVMWYFQTVEDDVAAVTDLIDYVVAEQSGDTTREQVETTLHHVTLPKLADLGVIKYDARSQTVRYYGSSTLERLLTVIDEADQIPEQTM